MSFYYAAELPWTLSEEDEARFRRILKRILITFLLLSLAMPFLPVPKTDRKKIEDVPPRLAKLVLEQRKQATPPVAAKAPEIETPTPKADKKPVPPKEVREEIKKETPPLTKSVETARKKAARSGLLAFSDDLADLRANTAPATLQKTAKLGPGLGAGSGPGIGQASGPAMGAGARAIITSNVAGGSGGISTSKLSTGTGGGGLAGRATTQVNSPLGGGGGGGGEGGTLTRGGRGDKAARAIEDIRLVFDRNKSAIYSIYSRVLREDPSLQGKVVLKITIAPSGQVSACQVVSSELHSPELERKLVARVLQFDFGAKDVGVMVVTYPVDFLPS